MTYENYIKAQLVRYCAGEAYHMGSADAVLAIAQVMANRVAMGWCGGDWLRVIEDGPKFAGTIYENDPPIEHRDLLFRRILQSVDDVYYGIADDSSVNNEQGQKSLYYADLTCINRQWFRDNILSDLENHPMLAKVGQLNFFA